MDIKTFRRTTPSSVGRSGIDRSTDLFLTYQLTMALYVETSWCPYQLFHRTFTIDLTASIVSCVVYTTFAWNSVSCRLPHLNWITKYLKLRFKMFKGIIPSYISFFVRWWKIQLNFSIISSSRPSSLHFNQQWVRTHKSRISQVTSNIQFLPPPLYDENQKIFYKDRGCVHYVIVSTVQWEPFQPAAQLYIHKMRLRWVAKSCERWRMRTGLICGKQMREQQGCFNKKRKENGSCVKPLIQLPFF